MNVPIITMDAEEAAAKFQEYRGTLKSQFKKIDLLMARTYKALKDGKRLIDIFDALRLGGVDEERHPRLAIAPANITEITWEPLHWRRNDACSAYVWGREFDSFRLGRDFYPSTARATARVPLIPPALRPVDDLSQYHILWEADWTDVPADPILLKHVAGNFYAIIAEWDLTELERSVVRIAGMRPRR